MRPPHLRPISFNFMHFLPENRMCAPPFATKQRPPIWKILDPPLGMTLYWIFLRENPNWKTIVSTCVCVLGVTLVIQPDFIFTTSQTMKSFQNGTANGSTTIIGNETRKYYTSDYSLVALGYMLPIVTGLTASIDVVVIKKFPYLMENILVVSFWCTFLTTTFSAIAMVTFENPSLPRNARQSIILTAHCVAYVLVWPSCTYPAKYISGNAMNVIFSTSVVLFLVAQYTVLSSIQPGNQNWMEVLGVFLVLFAACVTPVIEIYYKK